MRAEAGRAAHHGPQVARVGDGVEGDDERRLALLGGPVEQVVGVGVLVRRDLGREPLVHGPGGQPVELVLGDLEQADAALTGEPERLAQPPVALGALGDVHGGDGYAGPQRLDDRVAPAIHSASLPVVRRRGRAAAALSALAFCL